MYIVCIKRSNNRCGVKGFLFFKRLMKSSRVDSKSKPFAFTCQVYCDSKSDSTNAHLNEAGHDKFSILYIMSRYSLLLDHN